MDVVIVLIALALLVVVPILLWRFRRSRLARGLGDAGRYYNGVLGVGGGTPKTVVSGGVDSSGPPPTRG